MRQVLLAFCAVLLIAACGSGSNVEPAPIEVKKSPLRIEAKKHDGKYALFLSDETSPTTTDALKVALVEYAGVVDPGSGMKGHDERHQSENPVIFHAPPDAPTEIFIPVLELLVNAFIVKVWVELRRDGLSPLQCEVELPRDESMGPRRIEWLIIKVARQDGATTYEAGLAARGKAQVPAARYAETDSGVWEDRQFNLRRDALVDAFGKTPSDITFYDAGVQWMPLEETPPWGAVFQALAAIDELNTARRRERQTHIDVWVCELASPPAEEPPAKAPEKDAPKPFDLLPEAEPPAIRPPANRND